MFKSLEQEVSERLRQSAEILNHIRFLDSSTEYTDKELIKIQKGYLFVSLYSSIEYTLTNTVSRFLEIISREPKKPMEYKKYILSTILDSRFNAIRDCSKKFIWDKKSEFLDALFSPENANIDNSVFPCDGINISHKQIKDIWKFFHLSGPEIPFGINAWILQEIKEHRNAIAHGREKAGNIGARYTLAALDEKVRNVDALCWHIVETFKLSYQDKNYLHADTA